MVRRGLGVLLVVGVLCATGVASGTPCCTLLRLDSSNRAGEGAGDCCESSNCCRIEKRGPAQAEFLATSPDAAAAEAPLVSRPILAAGPVGASPAGSAGQALSPTDHPPPPGGRDTYLRISLFRV